MHPRISPQPLLLAALLLALPGIRAAAASPDEREARQQAAPSIRLLRVAAGPSGSVAGGEYRLDSEQRVFVRGREAQAIIYFQWEGSPASYRMNGRWRGPSGLSTSSEFDYRADGRRFGAYWVLPLSADTALGTWTLDALIDGVPAGSYSIDVTDDPAAAVASPHPILSPSQIYERLTRIAVALEPARPGAPAGTRGAFVCSPGAIATAFSAIDGVGDVVAVLPDGSQHPVSSLRAWSRAHDFAIVPVPSELPAPPHAEKDAQVGDRCYSLLGDRHGRTLTECTVVGRGSGPRGTQRLLLDFYPVPAPPGAPVVNQHGDLLGLVGVAPGPRQVSVADVAAGIASATRMSLVPVASLRHDPAIRPVPLSELRVRREVLEPVVGGRHVVAGGFATRIEEQRPVDQRDQFFPGDKKMVTFVSWSPTARLKGQSHIRLSSADTGSVVQSKPKKVNLSPDTLTLSWWDFQVPATPGTYRVEVLLNDQVMWRGTFEVRER